MVARDEGGITITSSTFKKERGLVIAFRLAEANSKLEQKNISKRIKGSSHY